MRAGAVHLAAISAALVMAVGPGLAHGETAAPSKAPSKPPSKTAARAPVQKRAAPAAILAATPASRGWHTPTPGQSPSVDATGRPMLVLSALNFQTKVSLPAKSDHGGFAAEDLDRATHALREGATGNEHPVDPRILDLVYRVQRHFNAQELRIISGYRTPRGGSHSNHGKGRAIDLVVPGASDEEVAKFAREQGFCGVGIYPVSGFVHIDVRERSYFWVDTSGPGKRSRTRGILADLAAKSDAAASARGEHAVAPFMLASDVDAALGASSRSTSPAANEDDDIDEGAISP